MSWCQPLLRGVLTIAVCALLSRSARAEEEEPSRPLHLLVAGGGYAALGGPSGYGPMLSLDLMPGAVFGRFGVRGELRGYRGLEEGSALVGLLYEAGASRPRLALNLLLELGLTHERKPIVGAGVQTSLWALGPLGVTSLTDLQLIIDGLGTRPALSLSLALHLGI